MEEDGILGGFFNESTGTFAGDQFLRKMFFAGFHGQGDQLTSRSAADVRDGRRAMSAG